MLFVFGVTHSITYRCGKHEENVCVTVLCVTVMHVTVMCDCPDPGKRDPA